MNGGFGASNVGAWCAALALAAVVSCGTEKKGEGGAQVDDREPAKVETIAKTEAPAAVSAEGSDGREIRGTATLITESKRGAESPLRLVIGDAGRLGGSLPIGGSECAVSGVVDEAIVRGWLECPPATGSASPRRGTLVGEKAGGSYSGTFAISDDGAATVLGGTWKAGGL